jgi:hypothetical protein
MTVGGSLEARDLFWVAAAGLAVVQIGCCVGREVLAASGAMSSTLALPCEMTVVAMGSAFESVPTVLGGVSAG